MKCPNTEHQRGNVPQALLLLFLGVTIPDLTCLMKKIKVVLREDRQCDYTSDITSDV